MTHTYVIGYFDHGNLGDEQYKETFRFIFRNFLPKGFEENVKFLDCDSILEYTFGDSDLIILGGGDILNNYFLEKINKKFKGKPNKILAISVGVPYISTVISTSLLQVIDFIFVRSKQDLGLLEEHFGVNKVRYLPDISWYLQSFPEVHFLDPCLDTNTFKILGHLSNIKKYKKIICFSVSRNIHGNGVVTNQNYDTLVKSLTNFIKYFLTFGYYIVLLPFNTNESGDHENDIITQKDILNLISKEVPNQIANILNIDFALDPKVVLQLYDFFYMTVPMRYHSALFSIYKKVPMLPLFTTRKIKNLLIDCDYPFSYEIPYDSNDLPTFIDFTKLIKISQEVLGSGQETINLLNKVNNELFGKNLKDVFEMDFISFGSQSGALVNSQLNLINLLSEKYPKEPSFRPNIIQEKVKKAYLFANDFAKSKGYPHFLLIAEPLLQDSCVKIISYILTNGVLNSVYNYGLNEKIFKTLPRPNPDTYFDVVFDEWHWVCCDYSIRKYSFGITSKLPSNPDGIFNIDYIDQVDYSGVHRSGWQYVYENIKHLHNDKSELYLDLYIDRTFLWNKEVNKFLGIVPYTKSWIGFVHHTFDTEFSEYNCYTLLDTPEFIESLKACKGLLVLSNDLKNKFRFELQKRRITVPVFALVHPTETVVPQFDYNAFVANKDKKIVGIGGWLRNIFSFYYLTLPKEFVFSYKKNNWYRSKITDQMRKVCLRARNSSNYFPNLNFSNHLGNFLLSEELNGNCDVPGNASCVPGNISCIPGNASQGSGFDKKIKNNWYRHYFTYTKQLLESTGTLEHLNNELYDELLTKNIVFVNLVDASAVNTVIECIVRCTPVIVNNCPAIIEMLGENYPLYFTDKSDYFTINTQILALLGNPEAINRANIYLKNLDKSKFDVNYFIDKLIQTVKALN